MELTLQKRLVFSTCPLQNEGGRHGYSSSEDHLDRDIHKEGYASASRQLGEKILSDSLGARNNSMVSLIIMYCHVIKAT